MSDTEYNVNLDLLSQRVTELERLVAQKADANPLLTAGTTPVATTTPASPSGLVALTTGTPGSVTFSWNPAPVTNLRYYEIEYAEDVTFRQQIDIRRTTQTFGDFNGISDTVPVIYARVRSVNRNEVASDWTQGVSSTGGVLSTESVAVGSFSSIHEFHQTSGFTSLVNAGTGSAISDTYGPLPIVVAENDVVIPRVIVKNLFQVSYLGNRNDLYMEFLRGPADRTSSPVVVDDAYLDAFSSSLPSSRVVSSSFVSFDEPGAGTWEYSIRYTTFSAAGNYLDATPFDVRMEFIKNAKMST